ncbi:MAG: hypothetical protein KBT36_08890 [Kurthia sp.]|nr:hypothetical protein [Candidatus Kurthia equi]
MTTFHSKEKIQEALTNFFTTYDYQVESLDDETNKQYLLDCITAFECQFRNTNSNWMIKCADDLDKIKRLYDNEEYQKNERYSNLCIEVLYKIKFLFELKNRRTKQVFDLKAENAQLRIQLNKLKNEQP